MHIADIALSLLYSSKHHLFGALPIALSLAIIVGGVYGALRLLVDALRVVTWLLERINPAD